MGVRRQIPQLQEVDLTGSEGGAYRGTVECPGCGATLGVELDTDGGGRLLETVEECRVCEGKRLRTRRYSARALLLRGWGTGEVSKVTGVAVVPLAALRQLLEERHGPVLCGCGKPASHRGICRNRRIRRRLIEEARAGRLALRGYVHDSDSREAGGA